MESGSELTTDVDSLLKIVKEKKEVAIAEVAKQLSVPEVTVESWADFLQEEGVIEMKYQFTKAYLVYKGEKKEDTAGKKKKEGEVFIEKKGEKPSAEDEPGAELDKMSKGLPKATPPPQAKKPGFFDKLFQKHALPPPPPPGSKERVITPADLTAAVKKSQELLANGDIEGVKQIYTDLKRRYDGMPEDYEVRRKHLINNLLELNKQLTVNVSKFKEKDIDAKEKMIRQIVRDTRRLSRKGKITESLARFEEIKSIYVKLPEGFLQRKLSINEDIMALHEDILNAKKHFFTREMDDKSNKIGVLLKQANTAIGKEDVELGEKIYNQIIVLQGSLPEGFFKTKEKIEKDILLLYNDLTSLKAEISKEEIDAKSEKIQLLLARTRDLIKNNNLIEAETALKEANSINSTLPLGFLERKTNLQKELATTNKMFNDLKIRIYSRDFKEKRKQILKLMSSAKKYIRRGEAELASTVYDALAELFSKLPKGFIEDRAAIREKMLVLYRDSVMASDDLFLQQVDEKIKDRYEELMKLIVQAHEHIENKDFKMLERDCEAINLVYEQLPMAFVKKKLRLISEVTKVNTELELYNAVVDVKKTPVKQYKKLRIALDKVYKLYDKLVTKCPEDPKLFEYVKDTCAPYSTKLIAKGMMKKSKLETEIKKLTVQKELERQKKKDEEKERKKEKKERVKKLKLEAKHEMERIAAEAKRAKKIEDMEKKEREKILDEQRRLQDKLKIVMKDAEKKERQRRKEEEKRMEAEMQLRLKREKAETERIKLEEARRQKQDMERRKHEALRIREHQKKLRQEELRKANEFNRLEALRKKEEEKIEKAREEREKLMRETEQEQLKIEELRQHLLNEEGEKKKAAERQEHARKARERLMHEKKIKAHQENLRSMMEEKKKMDIAKERIRIANEEHKRQLRKAKQFKKMDRIRRIEEKKARKLQKQHTEIEMRIEEEKPPEIILEEPQQPDVKVTHVTIEKPIFEGAPEPSRPVHPAKPIAKPKEKHIHMSKNERKLKKVDDYISQRLASLESRKSNAIVIGTLEPVVQRTQIPAPRVKEIKAEEPKQPEPEQAPQIEMPVETEDEEKKRAPPRSKLEEQHDEIEKKLELLSRGIITLPATKTSKPLPKEIKLRQSRGMKKQKHKQHKKKRVPVKKRKKGKHKKYKHRK